jgi:hypothetical protein
VRNFVWRIAFGVMNIEFKIIIKYVKTIFEKNLLNNFAKYNYIWYNLIVIAKNEYLLENTFWEI